MNDDSGFATNSSTFTTQVKPWLGLILALLAAAAFALLGVPKVAALVLMVIVGIAIWTKPNIATYLFAFLLFTNAPVVASRFHGVPSIVGAGVAGLLFIPLFHQIVILRKPLVIVPMLPVIGLFIAFRLLAVLWSGEKDLAIDSIIATIAEGLLLYVLVTNVIRTRETLHGVVLTILFAGSLLGALSIYQQVTGSFDKDFGGFAQTSLDMKVLNLDAPAKDARSAGPIGEKNYYAQFMLLLVPLAFAWIKTESRWPLKCLSIVTATLIMLGVASTASRGAAVGFVCMVLAMILLREVRVRHIAIITFGSVAILMLVPAYQQRLNSMISAMGVLPGTGHVQAIETSLQGRMSEMWAAALIFSEQPIGGVGPGNFPPEFLKKAGSLGFQIHAEQRMAHCSYLEIAAETGIVGLLLYLAILGVTLRELWRARQLASDESQLTQATAFILVVVVMMSTGLFLSFAFERYYWFILALAAVAATTAQDADQSDSIATDDRLSASIKDGNSLTAELTP